jgi:hypothetical protein
MIKRVSTVLLFVIGCPNIGWSSDNDELLNQIRIGHRTARQSIRELSCVYLASGLQPSKTVMASGKYIRKGDSVSIKDGNEGISTEDLLIRNGQCRRVARVWRDGKVEYGASLEANTQFFAWGDVWQRMLIDHSSPDGDHCDYDMVLDRIAKTARLSRDRIAGMDCVRIETEETTKLGHTKVLKIWHDSKNNYLIRKLESYDRSNPKDRTTAEVTEFLEAAPGIIVPVKCRIDIYRVDRLTKSYEIVLTEVLVNQPIPDSAITLPSIPKGTRLQDSIHGVMVDIGPDWQPVGPTTAKPEVTLAPASGSASPAEVGRPSDSEPWPISRYVLYGSIFVFATCVVILIVRRKRAAGVGDHSP